MIRNLRTAEQLIAALGAVAAVAACDADTGAPACNALATCCEFTPDPSSCYTTATSGELSDAGCGMQLTMYQQSGSCPVDAGRVPDADADAAHP